MNPPSWNRYSYTLLDPVNGIDPAGLDVVYMWNPPPPVPATVDAGGGGAVGTLTCSHIIAKGSLDPCADVHFGGKGGGPIKITKFSTTSKKALTAQNDLNWLKAALADDPSCSNWLTGVQTVIAQVLGQAPNQANGTAIMMVGVGVFSDPTVNAVAGTSGTNLGAGTAAITVNVDGAFFDSSVSVGYGVVDMKGGSFTAQIEILLHELAHLTGASGFIDNDAGNPAAQLSNNSSVEVICWKVLTMAGWK
jgi:hypothetical protein